MFSRSGNGRKTQTGNSESGGRGLAGRMLRACLGRRGKRSWMTLRRGLAASVLLVVVLSFSGCETYHFYRQAIKGQYYLISHQQRIQTLLKDGETPASLKRQLQLIEELRVFAEKDLKLPVDGHYQKYVDVHRPYVVRNVEAAPEFSMEPKTWWYPLVGSLEYRGYFAEKDARAYGEHLEKKGWDVYLGGASAYSTLGWFKDPVLSTFIFEPDQDLAETIFHELGHQRVFAHGDTDFNEAFATTVGQEGARRWLRTRGDTAAYDKYLAELERNKQFIQLIARARERLEKLYGDERNEAGKVKATKKKLAIPPEQLREEKQLIFFALQEEYVRLKASWGGDQAYENWFAQQVNNAQLNSVAAYYDLVPGFEQLLKIHGGDLEKFYEEAERLAKKPKKERQQRLRALSGG
jgi:predicted aminopeptidase